MKKEIYLALLWGTLLACGGERKPLEVLSMTANNPSVLDIGEPPVPGFFYVKNFSDNKECLKELLYYVKDTIRRELPFDSYCSYLAEIQKNNE